MKLKLIAAAIAAVVAGNVAAQIKTSADAFKSGQEFANGANGKDAAKGTLTTTTGTANVPKYNTNPPETSVYGDGKSLIGGMGSKKQTDCVGYKAGNAYDQQECDAVNYLTKMPGERPKFIIDKEKDPVLVNSKDLVANPGTVPASSVSACHMETTVIPGTLTTEICEQSTIIDTVSCKKTLLPTCGYVGAPITSHTTNRSGAVAYGTLTTADKPGLYNYKIEVPYRTCGSEGVGEVNFNLDTIGLGSYITINMTNLDDAAAIGVNGTTVFAGYPNNGPQYSGNLFPSYRQDFQIGYSWNEDIGGYQCVASDGEGRCTRSVWVSDVQTFYANTKLLDYCPSGSSPQTQKSFQYCDSESGYCSTISNYTPNNVMGFFCNAEGKFLMNRHEGSGTWAGSVSSAMPLKTGLNSIRVYWGTGPSGKACGNVSVYGQIFNVAMRCNSTWDDQCAGMRAAVKK